MPARVRPAALLLTGGASRRMGTDKATLVVGPASVPLAARTAALLVTIAEPVIEVGQGYTGLVAVQEQPPGGGPLCAMAAGWQALARAGADVLVVATDLPWLTGGLLRLLATYDGPGCVVPTDESGRPQPLCARYPAATMARAAALVAAGRRSVRALLDGEPTTWVPPSEWQPAAGRSDALTDVDTPDALTRVLGGRGRGDARP